MTAPLVPEEVVIRPVRFVPIYPRRLFSSTLFAVATPAEFRAAFCLWINSWEQTPSGSLPSTDRELCRLAELGGDLAKWGKVKRIALRHWELCDDGRLYHPVVAQYVLEAWEHLSRRRARTEAATAARLARRNGNATTNVTLEKKQRNVHHRTEGQAKLKGNNLDLKILNNPNPAHAREGNGFAGEHPTNGHAGDEDFLDQNWNPLGRFAPLAAQAPPSPGLKSKRKELLRMKLLRFVDATMKNVDRHKAIAGLCGTDPEHSEQWWLDVLDIRMRAEHWDDVA